MLKARIKPYDLKLGHVMRTLVHSAIPGRKFEVGKVYDVTDAEAKILRPLRSRLDSVDGPFAFDIGTEQEMASIMSGEAKTKLGLTPDIIAAIRETTEGRDVSGSDPHAGALTKADIPGNEVAPAASPGAQEPVRRQRRVA